MKHMYAHLRDFNVTKQPQTSKEAAIYVELPPDVIRLLNDGNIIQTGNKVRFFIPYVFERDVDDRDGTIFRVRILDEIPPDEFGMPNYRKLTDEEFAVKYGLDEYRTYKKADNEGGTGQIISKR